MRSPVGREPQTPLSELDVAADQLRQQSLDKPAGHDALFDRIERARQAVGAFRFGRSDIAARHDEVWAEILMEETDARQRLR